MNDPPVRQPLEAFSLGGVSINPATNEIGGVRVEAKAMDVLVALAAVAPGVLSVAQLLEEVWPRVVVGDNVVHQVIAQLRRALGDDARSPRYLQSIPRRGYRLIPKIDREGPFHATVPSNQVDSAVNSPVRVEALFPARSNRINVAIVPALRPSDRRTLEIATSITRYISCDGGPFRVVRADGDVQGRSIDYTVEVTVRESDGQLDAGWQVQWLQTGEIVWANRVEQAQQDTPTQVDRIVEIIGEGALRVITDHELRRIATLSVSELSYGQLVLKAARFSGWDRARIAERYALLARAIELEPTTALAYAVLADLLLWKLTNGMMPNADGDASIARSAAQQAFELDPDDPRVLLSVGRTYCRIGQFDQGLALVRRGYDLAPTIRAKSELATSLCFAGRPDEAIDLFAGILATMPAAHTFRYVYGRMAVALTQAGSLVDALSYSQQHVIHFPSDCYGWITHANLLAQLGRLGEGIDAINEARRLVPTLRLEQAIAHIEDTYGRNDGQRRHLTGGLRKLLH